MTPVSLLATVFNERGSIDAWLDALLAQSRAPDEIVIVDGGSTDGTVDRLRERAAQFGTMRVVVEPGLSIPQGRNRAFELARHDILAVTDAGTVADPDWLERLVAPLEADPHVDVSAGFYRPDGVTRFEYVLATVITPRLGDVDPETFLPSSRSIAVRRVAWERVGGYPSWLRSGEDLVFAMRLRDAGARFAFAADARVRWRPRPTLAGFFRQYWFYARGDGHAGLWPRRHAARYGAYAAGGVLLALRRRPARALLAAGYAGYLRTYVRRVLAENPFAGDPARTAWALSLVPVIVTVGDVAKMVGYAEGRLQRRRAGSPEALEHAPIPSHRRHGDDASLFRRRPNADRARAASTR